MKYSIIILFLIFISFNAYSQECSSIIVNENKTIESTPALDKIMSYLNGKTQVVIKGLKKGFQISINDVNLTENYNSTITNSSPHDVTCMHWVNIDDSSKIIVRIKDLKTNYTAIVEIVKSKHIGIQYLDNCEFKITHKNSFVYYY